MAEALRDGQRREGKPKPDLIQDAEQNQHGGGEPGCNERPSQPLVAIPEPAWVTSERRQEGSGRERPRLPAGNPVRSQDAGWPAVGHLPLTACIASPCIHLNKIPENLLEG